MTTIEPAGGTAAFGALAADFVPVLRRDYERRAVASETVVWSALAPEPSVLDPVAAVMLDVIDGTATLADLALDVHDAIGVSIETAQQQVARIVETYGRVGLLTASISERSASDSIAAREIFVSTTTPCSENSSRLGTTSFNLRFGEQTIRVACDSRRGAKVLRAALVDHLVEVDEDGPLAFVLTAPQGLKRTHELVDRSGFALSEARGLDSGLSALASHLTALLAPAPGTVRVRARAIIAGGHAIVCLSPLLFFPPVAEKDLVGRGMQVVDRLALDFDVTNGCIVNPPVPWPALSALDAGAGHVASGGVEEVTGVVAVTAADAPAHSPAAMVAQIGANALAGTRAEILDVACRVVEHAELRSTPAAPASFLEVLDDLVVASS